MSSFPDVTLNDTDNLPRFESFRLVDPIGKRNSLRVTSPIFTGRNGSRELAPIRRVAAVPPERRQDDRPHSIPCQKTQWLLMSFYYSQLGSMRKAILVGLALTFFCVYSVSGESVSLTPEEAAGHVGESATVCGMVVSATYAAQAPMAPTFLDLGKPYPQQIFTAVIFGTDRSKFGAPDVSMRDKFVCVTGEIFLFQGTPEMALRDPAQLIVK